MEDIVLIGGGGHARSVADSIINGKNYKIVGYTDLFDTHIKLPYLGTDDILESLVEHGVVNAVITIGYLGKGNLRDKLYHRAKQAGFRLPKIIDPSAVISNFTEIGEGVFIGKNAVINTGAKIDKMCIINTGSIVEHNNQIGAYSHIAVGVTLCGDVHIGEHTLIGANSTIIQGIHIGRNTIIGAGSVVVDDLPENSRFVRVGGGKRAEDNLNHCLFFSDNRKAYLKNGRYAA